MERETDTQREIECTLLVPGSFLSAGLDPTKLIRPQKSVQSNLERKGIS